MDEAITLDAWMKANGISQGKLATDLGVTQQYVSMLCDMTKPNMPSLRLLQELEDYTKGAVTLASFRGKGAARDLLTKDDRPASPDA